MPSKHLEAINQIAPQEKPSAAMSLGSKTQGRAQKYGSLCIKAVFLCPMKERKIDLPRLLTQFPGPVKTADLIHAGLSHKQIRRLKETNELEKLGRGLYRFCAHAYDERLEIARRIPNGVFCLYSACLLHHLSDFVPAEQHFCIPKKSRYVLPDYPPVQLYYWKEKAFELGIINLPLSGGEIRVYDPEKTVCDMFRMRNKIGIDLVKEVLKAYLERPDRNLAKLYEYARQLRVFSPLNQILTILL